jgi:hypothetical protein
MHVHVPEARHDELAGRIDSPHRFKIACDLGVRPDGDDGIAADCDGLTGEDTVVRHIDDVRVANQQVGLLARLHRGGQREQRGKCSQ